MREEGRALAEEMQAIMDRLPDPPWGLARSVILEIPGSHQLPLAMRQFLQTGDPAFREEAKAAWEALSQREAVPTRQQMPLLIAAIEVIYEPPGTSVGRALRMAATAYASVQIEPRKLSKESPGHWTDDTRPPSPYRIAMHKVWLEKMRLWRDRLAELEKKTT
jgi:hypothetical protein